MLYTYTIEIKEIKKIKEINNLSLNSALLRLYFLVYLSAEKLAWFDQLPAAKTQAGLIKMVDHYCQAQPVLAACIWSNQSGFSTKQDPEGFYGTFWKSFLKLAFIFLFSFLLPPSASRASSSEPL